MADKLNREAWLHRMAEMLRPLFRDAGLPISGRITVTMAAIRPSALGLCEKTYFKGGVNHIFISCYEDGWMADTVFVAGVLVHELLHAVLPPFVRHGPAFKDGMDRLGLTGKATATTVGPKLREHLTTLIDKLPPLPRHGLVSPPKKAGGGGGNKGMIRLQCSCCKITVFMKFHSYDKAGPPTCWNIECDENPEMDEVPEVKKK